MIITSRENKIYKLAKKLRDKRGRIAENLFITEGLRSVRDAIEKGACVKKIILCEGTSLPDNFPQNDVYTFAPALFSEISDTVTPQGMLALCSIPKISFENLSFTDNSCIVLCEAVQDPGNIGTIIRTAHASGCSAVILTKGCCDLYNPKTVRATMSAIFSVPIITDVSADDAITNLKKHGFKIYGGALTDNSSSLYETVFATRSVIIIGNEANGITDKTLKICDRCIRIPMEPDAESLNAAVAGAVMIYEQKRQKISHQ